MFKVTLEWREGEQLRSQTLSTTQTTKQAGKIRIGRDEAQCDVVLTDSEKTVSRLHAELFLNSTDHMVTLRNLTRDHEGKQNPIMVNHHKVIHQEIPLSVGTSLQFGRMLVTLSDIEVAQAAVTPSKAQPSFGIKCHTCGNVISYDYLGLACPYCGSTVQADDTVEFYRVGQ